MTIELTAQTIITAGSVVAAAVLLVKFFANGVRRYDKHEKQSTDIEALRTKHEADVAALEAELAAEIRKNNEELQLLTYGVLACLKGMQAKGCNGPVTDAVNTIEKYLNQKAHES
jgi:hypothetical protein